jgi:hypothetical protein
MVAFVQGNAVDGSASLAYSGAVGAASFLVCAIRNGTATPPSSVTDTVNGAWTLAAQKINDASTNDTYLSIWFFPNSAGGTPTVSHNGAGSTRMCIAEYSGMPAAAAVLASSTHDDNAGGGGNVVWNSGSVAVPSGASLAIGAYGDGNDGGGTPNGAWVSREITAKTRLADIISPSGSLGFDGVGGAFEQENISAVIIFGANTVAVNPPAPLIARRRITFFNDIINQFRLKAA